MYKQIATLKNFVNNNLVDTLEAAITTVDFDYAAECILTDSYPEEDKDVDRVRMLHDFLEVLRFIEEETSLDSVIDDTTYDQLSEKYYNLTGRAISTDIDVQTSTTRPMKPHKYPELVGTLDKVHFIYEKDIPEKDSRHSLEKWIQSAMKKCQEANIKIDNLKYSTMFKYDGLSVVLECEKNEVVSAVTRRSTEENIGLDVSHIFKDHSVVKDIFKDELPEEIYNYDFGIKTEIVMESEQFEEFKKIVPNPPKHRRSAVSMIINTLEESYNPEWFNYITVQLLQISLDHKLNDIDDDEWIYGGLRDGRHLYININQMSIVGLKATATHDIVNSFLEDVQDIYNPAYMEMSDEQGTPIDGNVITIINPELIEILGRKDSINKFQVAFKFPAGVKKTKLLGVDFQVGPIAGNITPVARIQPIEIGGATIENVGLSNYAKVERLNLHIGDEVMIKYDIVPKMYKDDTCKTLSTNKVILPDRCPICGSELDMSSEIVRCVNRDCESKLSGRITNYLNKLGIDGIGLNTIIDLIQMDVIHSIPDLYRLHEHRDTIVNAPGYGEKSYRNMVSAINSKLIVYPHELLGSLGIPDIGRRIMRRVCKEVSVGELLSDNPDVVIKMTSINGIGDKTAIKICTGILHNRDIIDELMKFVTLKPYEEDVPPDHVILFTKVRDKAFEEFLRTKCNCDIASSFTKNVDILIAGGESNKVQTARERGVRILTLEEAKEEFQYDRL